MALKHVDIWRAIDRLAEKHKLSPSALALKAGLSATAFNPSKRIGPGGRKRWPSTESIARILQVTNTDLQDFVALTMPDIATTGVTLPLLGYGQAGREGYFDDAGYPTHKGWEDIRFGVNDPHAFVLEITGKSMEPVYREGDRIVVAPSEKPRRGDRVVVRTKKGEVMVKELGRESAQKIELLSLNPDFPAVNIAVNDITWLYRILWGSQ